jgi:predicted RNase H-related nuclease YkuK (DUF458 family)
MVYLTDSVVKDITLVIVVTIVLVTIKYGKAVLVKLTRYEDPCALNQAPHL